MRNCVFLLVLLVSSNFIHQSSSVAAPPRNSVEWTWDEKSPSTSVLDTDGPTHKISAKGRVQFKKGIVIESARFLVYSGGQTEKSWNVEPEVRALANVGVATDVVGDQERSFRTVIGDPLMLDKAIFSVPGKIRLKVVAQITYKVKATDESDIVADFELPGYLTTPGK